MHDRLSLQRGHLTSDAFLSLDAGKLDELDRCRMLTHLEDCPECMDHYLTLLTKETLLEPPEGMEERIESAIHQEYSKTKEKKIIALKVTKLAVAVCLTMVLFTGGVMEYLGNAPRLLEERQIKLEQSEQPKVPTEPEDPSLKEPSPKEKRREWFSDLNSGFASFARSFNSFSLIGDGRNERQ